MLELVILAIILLTFAEAVAILAAWIYDHALPVLAVAVGLGYLIIG